MKDFSRLCDQIRNFIFQIWFIFKYILWQLLDLGMVPHQDSMGWLVHIPQLKICTTGPLWDVEAKHFSVVNMNGKLFRSTMLNPMRCWNPFVKHLCIPNIIAVTLWWWKMWAKILTYIQAGVVPLKIWWKIRHFVWQPFISDYNWLLVLFCHNASWIRPCRQQKVGGNYCF